MKLLHENADNFELGNYLPNQNKLNITKILYNIKSIF
ncbi:hypothetical protein J2Y40_004626 [Chryseobacterium sp. 2987]|nr:hypothetical protein [Chryseobacterium sp. 2987]